MVCYLILCRSLTYAQRIQSVLERSGISTNILRSPRAISQDGCSHSVQVRERELAQALVVLSRAGLSAKRIFMEGQEGSGRYQEVFLS